MEIEIFRFPMRTREEISVYSDYLTISHYIRSLFQGEVVFTSYANGEQLVFIESYYYNLLTLINNIICPSFFYKDNRINLDEYNLILSQVTEIIICYLAGIKGVTQIVVDYLYGGLDRKWSEDVVIRCIDSRYCQVHQEYLFHNTNFLDQIRSRISSP